MKDPTDRPDSVPHRASCSHVTSPRFYWYRNDQQAGQGTSYTANDLASGDQIRVDVYYPDICKGYTWLRSVPVKIYIPPRVIPTVKITSSSASICPGYPVTFTATPSGAETPEYQWKINGVVQLKTIMNNFTAGNLENNDEVSVDLISGNYCLNEKVSSNTIRMNVETVTLSIAEEGCDHVKLRLQGNLTGYYFQSSPFSEDRTAPFTERVTQPGTYIVRRVNNIGEWGCVSNPVTIPVINCNRNYIRERMVQEDGVTDTAQIGQGSPLVRYSYFDGLGRTEQVVDAKVSPAGYDIVTPAAYDRYGRPDKRYLPYVAGSRTGAYQDKAVEAQAAYYKTGRNGMPADDYPYTQAIFEASPLNRETAHYGPGEAWRGTSPHPEQTAYGTNAANTVRLWKLTTDNNGKITNASGTAFYPAGTLYRTGHYDEDGNQAIQYTDMQGRPVQITDALGNSVQYIYDDYGRPACILQPAFTATAFKETDSNFSRWVFAYRYDQKGRIVRKHIPGAGWTEMVYNRQDQPVMTQSAQQKSENKWCFNKYDVHGRLVMSGELTGANTREQWQALVDAGQYHWEERSMAAGNIGRYTNRCQPVVTLAQTDMILYYDRYDFDTGGAPSRQTTACNRTQGLHTGTRARVLGSDTWLTSINYYNDRGRLQESISKSARNRWERLIHDHDFTGRVTQSVHSHDNNQVVLRREQTYDHAGRPADTWTTIGQGERVLTTRNTYNELGQPATSRLHGTGNGTAWLQEVDYRYNIRGWLSSINGDMDRQDAFSERMLYHEPSGVPGLSSTPAYNGNISSSGPAKAPAAILPPGTTTGTSTTG